MRRLFRCGSSHAVVVLLALIYVTTSPSPLLAQRGGGSAEPLHDAASSLDIAGVRQLLKGIDGVTFGANPNALRGPEGLSVLRSVGINAMISGEGQITPETEDRIIAIYDLLFDAGARILGSDRLILHPPAIAGAVRVTKYLLERGADPNAASISGSTPIILATHYGHPDVVAVLTASGAKPLDRKTEAQIRLISAAVRGDLVTVRQEIARGAEVDGKNTTGETPLMAAIRGGLRHGGNLVMVRELLKLGAQPNISGRFIGPLEMSPLHAAVYTNESIFERSNGPGVIDALLKAGARVSSTDAYKKRTPLHIAASLENTRAAAILLKAGAKVMPRDEDGKTPLDLAESGATIQLLKSQGAKEQ